MIRLAREDDLEQLRSVERAAGRAFTGLGMDGVAEDEPFSIDELREHQRAGLAWVYAGERDRPIAYLIVLPVDGNVHIEQVSVHPDAAGRGSGAS